MPLLTTSVPNLVQGVSQQPDNLRYPGQAEEQVNAYSSVVDGLTKRPNTNHVKDLFSTEIPDDSLVHFVDRDTDNQHVMVFANNGGTASVSIFNVSLGASINTTITADAQTYLNTATTPLKDLRALTVADYTFVANKQTTVSLGASVSTALANEAIVFVKQGNDGSDYKITIDPASGAAQTAHVGHKSHNFDPPHSSEDIATRLASMVNNGTPGDANVTAINITGVSAVSNGSAVKITLASDTDTITVSDSLSNTGLGLVYKEVSAITDLPIKCYNGFRVKVKGDVELVQDDYYVKFETKDNKTTPDHFGEGTWVEDIGYGLKTTLNDATMPIQIVPTFNVAGETTLYTIDVATWTDRLVGDDDTNAAPTLVDKKINDVFFFKNRLGFLTDSSVVFSEADKYFNFFRTTVLTLLDGDPIDVGVAHTKVSTLKHAVPFQEKLVLFSPQSQFVLRGTDLLTPKTVNVSPITEYDVSSDVKPLALTNYVYFPFSRANFEGVYEFYVDATTDVFDAAEVTAQTPKYVPTALRQLVGTPAEDVIVATSSSNLKHLFIYKYFWQNKEKIQSSWSRFEFADKIVGAGFIDSDLYLVTKDGTKTNLERISMESGAVDSGKDYAILLDRRVPSTDLGKSYSATTKLTTVTTMPYDPVNSVVYTAVGGRYAITRVSSSSFTVVGDITPYVSHGGSYYRCLKDHVSASSNEPGTGGGSTYWAVDGTVSSAQLWSSASVSYKLNDFYVGLEYDMEYTFSTQTLKQPTERGGKATSNFTYQTLRNGAIDYSDTGHFTVEVTPLYRDTYNYAFNPSTLGASSLVGSLVVDSGSFRFPIHAKHDEATIKVKSSSALPAKLLAAEFESFVTPRSRRYGS